MKNKFTIILALTFFSLFIGYWYLTQESPVYCFQQGRVIPDQEFLQTALKAREGEIMYYGGIDAYEKHFISLNRHPNEAGRDFDIKDPHCCEVHRGASKVQEHCTVRYPVCVSLNFPKLDGPPTYGSWRGRVYFFNECGKLEENY